MKLKKSYKFNGLPVVDGKLLRKSIDIVDEIYSLLSEIGYTFCPFTRPVPPLLVNYRVVERRKLVNLLKALVGQVLLLSSVDNLVLSNQGFCVNIPMLKEPERLVRVSFSSLEYKDVRLVPMRYLSNVIDDFMSKPYINKVVIIN